MRKMIMAATNGSQADIAHAKDWLRMSTQYEGLANFIKTCSTPMTIAIQGDWGTGKTSAMKNIQKKLEKNEIGNAIPCMWFKTWQFSALGENNNIFLEFMLTMMSEIGTLLNTLINKADENSENYARLLDLRQKHIELDKSLKKTAKLNLKGVAMDFGRAAFPIVSGILDALGIPLAGKIVEAAGNFADKKMDNAEEKMRRKGEIPENTADEDTSEFSSITLYLAKKCEETNELISEILKCYPVPNCRLCIFVDDLDRLQPKLALELLEGMKNFIEYKNCVFVLAIDKAVIYQGLRSKYDEKFLFEIDNDGKNNGRTRADKFFDKIIQVPYALREKDYDLEEYMSHLLGFNFEEDDPDYDNKLKMYNAQLKAEGKPNAADYADFLNSLDLRNPRSIKRYYNLKSLYSCMLDPKQSDTAIIDKNREWYDYCFFAVTTLQIEYSSFYTDIFEIVHENKSNDGGENVIWNALTDYATSENDSYIGPVVEVFRQASEIPEIGATMDQWLSNIFTLSNYNGSFNEKQIYMNSARKILEYIETNNAYNLDFTEINEKLSRSNKELTENFGSTAKAYSDYGTYIVFGGKTTFRPYLILSLNGKAVDQIADIPSFEPYPKAKASEEKERYFRDNSKNYYFYDAKEDTVSLYLSGNSQVSKDAYKVLKLLGFISNIPTT